MTDQPTDARLDDMIAGMQAEVDNERELNTRLSDALRMALDQRDEAREWARRMKAKFEFACEQRDHWAKRFVEIVAENARLRGKIDLLKFKPREDE